MDYSYFITEVAKRRRPATTRELTKIAYSAPKNTVSLAEGMPNEETFPFTEISFKLYDDSSFTLDGDELGAAFQYIPTQGYPPLLQALREFQRKAHAPPLWESSDIVVVSGSQDGLSKALEAIIGTGDPILVPDPFYPGVEVVVAPHKAELITIAQDDEGPIPEILRETLRNRELSGGKMPKIMYINATGTNPTGIIIPLERRKEIYRIACEYNFLLLDDDPYHFMHFDKEEPKSFLSLDTEGRVIRLDSFSKVISSGIRLGFMTAASPLIACVQLHLQSSHLHAPTLSQVIIYKLMKLWGYEGLMQHFMHLRAYYKERRDIISTLARKHLNGLADFNVPRGGFFLWIKVPGIKNTWKMIMQRGVTEGVIMAPGAAFMRDTSKPCNAIRASFTKASYEEMDLALERLAQLIRTELAENYIENVDT
ncbi:PREDICTED: kynurenine/alpha-aminoadipate aminotransferase, mitochondrial-like [Wasmannia auropunctata]|uniref:kynurenine/alpha-aminoadipate aminotransferase, mitochondrial-like n=1 Tax=Wasmannia auropunctata TaxID=64793 RepID=UPI0005EE7BBE|nr:PREDICTED: kynurenine/alpha-aminoadipate aminotransferase, mitochondrial-like [Wasmannia auropunctata]